MAEMVPNPLYKALGEAIQTVEPLLDEVERNIETPFQAFRSGKVWNGPAAERFEEQLTHHRTRVRACGDKIISDLRQALTRTPQQVTEEEAKAIKARYGLP